MYDEFGMSVGAGGSASPPGGDATDYGYGDTVGVTDYGYGDMSVGVTGGGTDYGNYDYTAGGTTDFDYGYESKNDGGDDDLFGLGGGGGEDQDFYGNGGNTLRGEPEAEERSEENEASVDCPLLTPPEEDPSKSIMKLRAPVVVKELGIPLENDDMVSEDLHKLRQHHLFRNVYWNDFYKIATKWLDRFHIPKGTVLARQGSSLVGGTHYCIISKGLVNVERSGITLTTLTPGDSFGEQQLIYGQPAPSTLICQSYVEAWGIQKEVLERLKSSHQVRRRKLDGSDPPV